MNHSISLIKWTIFHHFSRRKKKERKRVLPWQIKKEEEAAALVKDKWDSQRLDWQRIEDETKSRREGGDELGNKET